MKQYDKLLQKTKNTVMALRIMEQAAKDSGGQFTNKQEVDHTSKGESMNKPTTIELVAPNVKGTN